jgi:hypothetical protein
MHASYISSLTTIEQPTIYLEAHCDRNTMASTASVLGLLPTSSLLLAASILSRSRTIDDAIDVDEVAYLRGILFLGNKPQSHHEVVALDIDHQGMKSPLRHCNWQDEETFMNSLPPLAADKTRVLLFDVGGSRLSQTWMEKLDQSQPNHLSSRTAVRRSPLSYGFFEAPSLIPTSHAKAYTFDLWDLQNLWTSSSRSRVRPFILQNNVPESLLQLSEPGLNIRKYMGAIRQRLFLGPHVIPFWECISSVESHYGEDGRLESK